MIGGVSQKSIRASTKEEVRGSWLENLDALANSGVGEVLINVVDKDGTLLGPDIGIATAASKRISQPLIYLGGVSNLQDIKSVAQAGAQCRSGRRFFVFKRSNRAVLITYYLKNYKSCYKIVADVG